MDVIVARGCSAISKCVKGLTSWFDVLHYRCTSQYLDAIGHVPWLVRVHLVYMVTTLQLHQQVLDAHAHR
jgi:hypothetical protein